LIRIEANNDFGYPGNNKPCDGDAISIMKTKILPPLIALLFGALACNSLSSWSLGAPASFEGYYTSGFEVSSFVPCGSQEQAGYGNGYWLNGPPGFYESYNQIVSESGHDPATGYLPVYVEFEGQLSPEGNFGHLGAYSREITVTNLILMTLDGTCPD
jgi:hypothetical protein